MNFAAVTGATFPGRERAHIVFNPISFAFQSQFRQAWKQDLSKGNPCLPS